MDTSKLALSSVRLTNGGMKGLEVDYLLPSVKGNVQFFDIYKTKRKAPIHAELENCFLWLRSYMLDICGYTLEKEEREYLMNNLEMTGVHYGDKGVILTGKLSILGGNKILSLVTPLIKDDLDFPEYAKLTSIIDGIYTETKEYMQGKKAMSDAVFVTRYNAKNEEFDLESFNKMTKTEQREMATKILEEQGCVVFHSDEIVAEDEGAQGTTSTVMVDTESLRKNDEQAFEEEQQPEQVSFTKEEIDNFGKQEVVTKPAASLDTPVPTLLQDEDFQVPLKEPVALKKSTAKKKVA